MLQPELSDDERDGLRKSAQNMKDALAQVKEAA
jgi:hypothetical protein